MRFFLIVVVFSMMFPPKSLADGKRDIHGIRLGMSLADVKAVRLPSGPCSVFDPVKLGGGAPFVRIKCGDRFQVPAYSVLMSEDANPSGSVVMQLNVEFTNQLTTEVMLQELASQFGYDRAKPVPPTRSSGGAKWLLSEDTSIEMSTMHLGFVEPYAIKVHRITLTNETALAAFSQKASQRLQDQLEKSNPRPKF